MTDPAEPWLGWPGADGKGGRSLAVSIVVNVEEGSEASVAEGDKGPEPVDELGVVPRAPIRNFGNESNYRYGLNRGAERIFGALAARKMPATVTAAALSLERAPAVVEMIRQGGHEVCAHGWRWLHQFKMDEEAERDFIRKARDSIAETTGAPPEGWLSRYLLTENTRRLLVEEGYGYHMDDYSDDLPFWDAVDGNPILILPYAIDTNDMKLWSEPAYTPEDWLRYALDSLEVLVREGEKAPRMMSIGLHLRIIGRPGRIGYLERLLDRLAGDARIWVARRADIAAHWRKVRPYPELSEASGGRVG